MLSGSGIQLPVAIGNVFSLAGFVNFLGSYGRTDTKQDVMLKTMTGNKVELKSVTQIPYVSSVGVATTGTTNSTGSNGLLGSASTSTANDGITLKVTPTYDHAARSVAMDIDLSIQSVLSFNNLSAGSQIGSFTQPTTADRSFTDILRVRPGETAVIGGLTYDAVSKNTTSPLPLRDTDWESRSLTVQRQTMFIVIRPTVRTFGALQEKVASAQDGFDDSGDDTDDLPLAPNTPVATAVPSAAKPVIAPRAVITGSAK
jgi:type II secretory pathway component GspD/PulD (secretin)